MILEYDGLVVDFFERFPKDITSIGLHFSGGADSSLILYLLVKMIQERNLEDKVTIYPISGYDIMTPDIVSYDITTNIINWIKNKTKANCINPIEITPYFTLDHQKDDMLKVNKAYLKNRYNCDIIIDGISLGMPESPRDGIGQWTDDKNIKELAIIKPYTFPWATVNKKFIAAQYKKLGIEDLSNLTNSCVVSSQVPCKECWWCKERYWAFDSYDGGIQ